jgi:hypothetical protein
MSSMLRMAVAGLGTMAVVASAQARSIEEYRVGNWTVIAYADDTTGAFTHCGSLAQYRSGAGLMFSVNPERRWSIGFSGNLGSLRPGQSYPARYQVDRGDRHTGQATAVNANLVQIGLPEGPEQLQELRTGRELRLELGAERLTFALAGAPQVLSELEACVERGQARAPGATGRPAAPLSEAERKLEATLVAVNILSRAQVAGFELKPSEVPPRLADHDVTWRAQGLSGSLRIAGLNGTSADKVRSDLIASDLQACQARFVSEGAPAGDGLGTNLFTSCDGDKGWSANYMSIARPEGGFYVLSLVGAPDKAEAVKTLSGALRTTAPQVVK